MKTSADDFIRLHAHAEEKAAPPLLESFVTHLDSVCGTSDATDAELLRDALARLARAHPAWHAAVVAMAVPGATVRSVAPVLNVSPKTACMHHNKGLDKLRQWCHSDAEQHAHVV